MDTMADAGNIAGIASRSLGVDVNELTKAALTTDMAKAESIFRPVLVESVMKSFKEKLELKNSHGIVIDLKLTSEEQGILTNNYPEFEITFTHTAYNSHAVAHASRILETNILVRIAKTAVRNREHQYDFVDMGGNFLTHFKNRDFSHSCCPILDAKDDARYTERFVKMQKVMLDRKYRSQRSKYVGNLTFVCKNRGENCNATAPVVIMIHSAYDPTNREIADCLERKKAIMGHSSLMFSPDIICFSRGYLPNLKVYYEKWRKGLSIRIKFYFANDTSTVYEHDYRTYLSKFLHPLITSSSGTSYHVEYQYRKIGIMFMKYIKSYHSTPASKVEYNLWDLENLDKVVVTTYDWSINETGSSPRLHMVKSSILVDKGFYDIIYNYALTKTKESFNLDSILSAAVSFNTRFMVNGQMVTGLTKVRSGDLLKLCTAIYIMVYQSKWEQSQVMKTVQTELEKLRSQSSRGFWKAVFDLMMLKPIYHALIDSDMMSYLIKHLAWSNFKEHFPVSVDMDPKRYNVIEYIKTKKDLDLCEVLDLFEDEESEIDLISAANDALDTVAPISLYDTEPVTCTEALELSKVPGDGNCCSYAAMRVLGLDMTVEEFKKDLADKPIMLPKENRQAVMDVLTTDGKWGDIDFLYHVSKVHGVKFCVHDRNTNVDIRFGKGKLVHLHYRGCHYDALLPTAGVLKPRYVEPDPYFPVSKYLDFRKRPFDVKVLKDLCLYDYDVLGYKSGISLEVLEVLNTYKIKPERVICAASKTSATLAALKSLDVMPKCIYADNTFNVDLLRATGGRSLPTMSSREATTRMRINVVGTVDTVILESYRELEEFYINVTPKTKFVMRLTFDQFTCHAAALHKVFRSMQVIRPNVCSLVSDVIYVVGTGIRLYDHDDVFNEGLLSGVAKMLYNDLARCEMIMTNVGYTNNLSPEDWRKFVLKYLKRNTLSGGGSVLSQQRVMCDDGDVDLDLLLTSRYNELGLYDRACGSVYDSAESLLFDEESAIPFVPPDRSINVEPVDGDGVQPVKSEVPDKSTVEPKFVIPDDILNGEVLLMGKEVVQLRTLMSPVLNGDSGGKDTVVPAKKNISVGVVPVKSVLVKDDEVETGDAADRVDLDLPELREELYGDTPGMVFGDARYIDKKLKDVPVLVVDIAGEGRFRPKVLDESVKTYVPHHNAMYEQIEEFRIKKYTAYSSHAAILKNITSMNYRTQMKKHQDFGLVLDNELLINNTEIRKFAYKFILDDDLNGKFVPFEKKVRGFALVSVTTEKFLEPMMYDATKKHLDDVIHRFDYNFTQGVPGCGKSTYIMKHHRAGDLVLFPTRAARADFLKKLNRCKNLPEYRNVFRPDGSDTDVEIDEDNYRTLTSYLINSDKHYERVWIDEALMYHPGSIMLVVVRSGCDRLIMLGDFLQIPYINRDSNPLKYTRLERLFDVTSYLNKSYRVRRDVAAVYEKDYQVKAGLRNFETVDRQRKCTVFVQKITGIQDVVKKTRSYHVVLCFKQSEKQDLLNNGISNVLTVHEFQGQEAENIALVRLSVKKADTIYNSDNHVLVALTRHTGRLTYFTVLNDSDLVTQKKKEIMEWLSKPDKMSGGAVYGVDDVKTYGNYVKLDPRVLARGERINKGYVVQQLKSVENPMVAYIDIRDHYDPKRFETEFKKYNVSVVSNGFTPQQRMVLDKYVDNLGMFMAPLVRQEKNVDFEKPTVSSGKVDLHSSIVYLQYAHDLMFDHSLVNQNYDSYIIENTDYSLYCDPMKFSLSHRPVKDSKFSCLRPVLRTVMPPPRKYTQMETIIAIVKRNHARVNLSSLTDVDALADAVSKKFISSYLTSDVPFSELGISMHLIREWMKTQSGDPLPRYDDLESFGFKNFDEFMITIKKTPKVKLEGDPLAEYLALQTICYQGPDINVLFCSIFRELRMRLTSVLKDRFVIFNDMSLENFETKLDGWYYKLLGSFALEIDMSKYDKSQEQLCLEIELRIYKFLGLPDELISFWRLMHEVTKLYDRSTKVKTEVTYQRKSGDACTFFGNTVVLMGVLCSLYEMDGCRLGMFAGDDSLLFMDDEPEDKNLLCANVFNFESKMFKYSNYYFCSKFLIVTEKGTYFVPDPVKLLVKLGRHDIKNFEHLKEYVTSLRDLVKQYNRVDLALPLSLAVAERYDNAPSYLHEHLYKIINSDDIFSMFTHESGTILYPKSANNKLE